jgi:hypothetical protein
MNLGRALCARAGGCPLQWTALTLLPLEWVLWLTSLPTGFFSLHFSLVTSTLPSVLVTAFPQLLSPGHTLPWVT